MLTVKRRLIVGTIVVVGFMSVLAAVVVTRSNATISRIDDAQAAISRQGYRATGLEDAR